MLTVLGGLAEFERELIRARTGEGRGRAKARGVRMGRPPKLPPHQIKEPLPAATPANGCLTSRAPATSPTARFGGSRHEPPKGHYRHLLLAKKCCDVTSHVRLCVRRYSRNRVSDSADILTETV
jgi:hypothetical protein